LYIGFHFFELAASNIHFIEKNNLLLALTSTGTWYIDHPTLLDLIITDGEAFSIAVSTTITGFICQLDLISFKVFSKIFLAIDFFQLFII
jgi:hypothetical protein